MKKAALLLLLLIGQQIISTGQHLYHDTTVLKTMNVLKASALSNRMWLLVKEDQSLKLFEAELTYQSINILNPAGFTLSANIKSIAAGPNNSCFLTDGKLVYKYSNNTINTIPLYNNQPSMDIKSMVSKGDRIYLIDNQSVYTIQNNSVVLSYGLGDYRPGSHQIIQLDSGFEDYTITFRYDGKLNFFTRNEALFAYTSTINYPDTVYSATFIPLYPKNYLVFASGDSLYYYHWSSYTHLEEKIKANVKHLVGGFEYGVAAAGDSSLTVYSQPLSQRYTYKFDAHVNEMFAENSNVLWVATTKGLIRFVDRYTVFNPNIKNPFCLNSQVVLSACNSNLTSFQWQRYGQDILGADACQITVSDTGQYRLISRANYQWKHKDTSNVVTYFENKQVDNILRYLDRLEFCEGLSAKLYITPTSNNTYKWYLNEDEMIGESGSYINAVKSGVYKCLTTNCNGYSKYSNTRTLIVHPLPDARIFTRETNPFCGKDSLHVYNYSHLAYYSWYFRKKGDEMYDMGTSGKSANPKIVITVEGELRLHLYDDYGCSSESSVLYCKPLPSPFVMIVKDNDRLVAQPYLEINGSRLFQSNISSYKWYLNDQPIQNATDSSLQVNSNGNYTVSVVDNNGCSNISERFSVYNTGIDEIGSGEAVSVFPTICSTTINVRVSGSSNNLTIRIFNSNGILKKVASYNNVGSTSISLPVEEFAEGLYIITINNGKDVYAYKFIKSR